jgi:hypothetical protein
MKTIQRATMHSVHACVIEPGNQPAISIKITIKDTSTTTDHTFSGDQALDLLKQAGPCGLSALDGRDCDVLFMGQELFVSFPN